ncbi:MAG: F0F1 ATP synthase subunit A [Chloroflexaceae bacterium]|nr:F0F1 ATP synthase subunit A [Chloroflexaceae bacterium]
MAIAVIGAFLVFGLGYATKSPSATVAAEPVFCLGGQHAGPERCASGLPITDAMITTIIVDITLILLVIFATRNMQLVPRGLQNAMEAVIEALYNFAKGVDRENVNKFFPYFASIFLFVLFSNLVSLIPFVGTVGVCVPEQQASIAVAAPAAAEGTTPGFFDGWPGSCPKETKLVPFFRSPSTDLNNTFAWSLVMVVLIQVFGFQALGLGYLTKFFNFKEGPIMAFVGFIELISEVVRIMAFALRLFGNIFAGKVIILVMTFLFPFLLPLPFYGLELFVALIQAIIFGVLVLVFMSLATQAHGGHDDHGHGHGHGEAATAPTAKLAGD